MIQAKNNDAKPGICKTSINCLSKAIANAERKFVVPYFHMAFPERFCERPNEPVLVFTRVADEHVVEQIRLFWFELTR